MKSFESWVDDMRPVPEPDPVVEVDIDCAGVPETFDLVLAEALRQQMLARKIAEDYMYDTCVPRDPDDVLTKEG